MNAIDRLKSTLRFEKTDRIPVFSHIYGFASLLNQIPLKDYLNSAELMAGCQLASWKRFGYDAIAVFADNSLEAEALGSMITYPDDAYPQIKKSCLKDARDWKYLALPDPAADGRMPVVLEACRTIKAAVGEEAAVVGTVQGPMTLAGQLVGIEKLIYFIVDQPLEFCKLLEFTTRVMLAFGKAFIEAGAHVIHIFDPSASCSVINRAVFNEYVLPQLTQAFKEFKDVADPICWLNITGQTEQILDLFPETGADLFNIDYLVPISSAMQKLPHQCINGNIKPFSFVSGDAQAIRREAGELLKETRARGGFILSPGCEIPLEAKVGNIEAMMEAVHRND